MTRPRQILPGSTYLLTRRCTQRQFLLKPSRAVEQIFLYCLAYAATQYGILLHAFMVLANHFHASGTDPKGNIPRFMQCLDQLLARALNRHHGRWENFWAPGSYSEVELIEPEDQLEKMLYTLTNPVRHGLVHRARRWPGLKSLDYEYGKPITVRRPEGFFRDDGPMPEEITFTLTRPPGYEHLTDAEFSELLANRLDEREREIQRERKAEGKRFAGEHAIAKLRITDTPETPAARRRLNPRIACQDPGRRVVELERLKAFLLDYRACFERWRNGHRRTVFPAGTYQLRVQAGVECRPPP